MSDHSLKVSKLNRYFLRLGFKKQSAYLNYLMKTSEGIAGTDFPVEDIEVEGVGGAIEHLKQNPGIPIFLDTPAGNKKKFGAKKDIKLPFHYGEFTGLINPSDEMFWDLIVVPSQSKEKIDHFRADHSLVSIGYVPINPDEELWSKMTKEEGHEFGKKPPIGNDKIIIADLDKYSKNKNDLLNDKQILNDFFDDLWQFEKIKWFEI
jgi:hypothetical protein